jgi:hypothetical protein
VEKEVGKRIVGDVGRGAVPEAKSFPKMLAEEEKLALVDEDFSERRLRQVFPKAVVDSIQGNLEAKGLKASGFRIQGKAHRISWSERVHLRIDAKDDEGAVIGSYFVLQPHNDLEVEDTVRMSRAGCAVETLIDAEGRGVRTTAGRMVIRAYPMDNRLHLTFKKLESEDMGAVFGQAMADMALKCVKEGVLYDFLGHEPISGEKGRDRTRKGRNSLMNCILDGVGDDMATYEKMKPLLVDWGGAVHLADREEADVRSHIVDFIANTIKVIYSSTTNLTGSRSLWEFTSRIGLEKERTVTDLVTSMLRGAGGVSYNELVRDAWGTLCGEGKIEKTEQELHWGRVRENMWKKSEEVRDFGRGIPREWEGHVMQIVDGSDGLIDRTAAAQVIRDMMERPGIDLGLTHMYFNKRSKTLEVLAGGKNGKVTQQYRVVDAGTDAEFDSIRAVCENQVGEEMIASDHKKRQIIVPKVSRKQHLRVAGASLNADQCALVAESASRLINNLIDNNIYFEPSEYKRMGFVELGPGLGRFRLAFVNESRSSLTSQDEPLSTEQVRKHVKAVASLCLNNMSHGVEAWKTFEVAFPAYAHSESQRDQNIGLLEEAKIELVEETKSTGRYEKFFEKSAKAMRVKDEARRMHQRWVELRTSHKPEHHFHVNTLNTLRGFEGRIHEAVHVLTRMDEIFDSVIGRRVPLNLQDLVPDISSVRVGLMGNNMELAEQAVKGNIAITQGALIVKLFRHERKPQYEDYNNRYAVFEFDERGLRTPKLVSFHDIDKYFKPSAFRVLLQPATSKEPFTEVRGLPANQRYKTAYLENFYSDQPDKLVFDKDSFEVIEASADAESIGQQVYGARSVEIIGRLRSYAASLPKEEEKALLKKMPKILDPKYPEFIDDRFGHEAFSIYRDSPDVLDAKVRTSYRNLDHRLSLLFTLENVIDKVHKYEEDRGRRLDETEQVQLLERLEARGEIKRVRMKGERPGEYIKSIKYLKDGNHYVVKITVETDSGPRSAIIKRTEPKEVGGITTNLMAELVPSSILLLMRTGGKPIARTPMVVSLDQEYGVESIAEGKPINETPEELRIKHQDRIAFQLGIYSRISNIIGDGHAGNTLLADSGEVTRIDLERSKRWERDSSKTLDYYITVFGLDVLRTHVPSWPQRRSHLWGKFMEGMRFADTELKKPEIQREIRKMVRTIGKNYPPERTGLTPEFARDIIDTINLPLERVMEPLIRRQLQIFKEYQQSYDRDPFDPTTKRINNELKFWEREADIYHIQG